MTGYAGTVPAYLEIARSGTTFTAYTSTDGATWTPVPNSTIVLNGLSGAILAGLAAASHAALATATITYTGVTVAASAPLPPGVACITGWSCADIGYTAPKGTQTQNGGAWTIQGAGADIWGTADQFHFVSQNLPGDGGVSAQVTGQTNTDPWAKAGVMLRATTDPGSAYYAALVTPGNGVTIQYRDLAGNATTQVTSAAGTVPAYLKVARVGTTFSAYTSTDGVTWTYVFGSTVTLNGLTGNLAAGMAVSSHVAGALGAATFIAVTIG
jgi:hypothetical protein